MLEEKIYKDYIEALKKRDKHKIDFLSFIRSELKNSAINLKKDKLDDNEALTVLKTQKKRLQETKETIASSQRTDLIEKTEKELIIINGYLPEPLDDRELLTIIDQAIVELGAISIKDMGKVMKQVLAKVASRADSKRVSELVRNKLSSAQA